MFDLIDLSALQTRGDFIIDRIVIDYSDVFSVRLLTYTRLNQTSFSVAFKPQDLFPDYCSIFQTISSNQNMTELLFT